MKMFKSNKDKTGSPEFVRAGRTLQLCFQAVNYRVVLQFIYNNKNISRHMNERTYLPSLSQSYTSTLIVLLGEAQKKRFDFFI